MNETPEALIPLGGLRWLRMMHDGGHYIDKLQQSFQSAATGKVVWKDVPIIMGDPTDGRR